MRRLLFVLFAALPLFAASELTVDLKFVPQEGVQSSSPDLAPSVLDRSVRIVVEDGRGGDDALAIGKGTDDDDRAFPIRATTAVLPYLAATSHEVAEEWGIRTSDRSERVLTLHFTRFFVDESNKALGSVYAAEVKLTFTLAEGRKLLAEGAASGSAHRYGRAKSADNANEVLSDALKETLANTFGDSRLQRAWASGKAAPGTSRVKEPAESAEQRLRKLDELRKKGLITKEEYDRKRAEILGEL
ncbi:MAG TPA: SHOCT domain-containing protein [Thermoanaerobaculia bacterium]|nr:SHOCT domain-containing protein [Thermoanaerobaculia bacterium]